MHKSWSVDDGIPWWYSPSGIRRLRGEWRTCLNCGERFPAVKSGRGRYCSPSCSSTATAGSIYATREDLFLHWTPEECWLAGLLWTDGGVTVGGSCTVGSISLSMTDEDAVAAAAAIAGRGYRRKERWGGWGSKPLYSMQIGHREAVSRIFAHGIAEPKLTTRPWPDLPHPASFLRGVFDGDGTVRSFYQRYRKRGREYVNKTPTLIAQLCGNAAFLEGMQQFLATQGIPVKNTYQSKNIRVIQWAKRDSLRLAEIMYSEPGPYITRKRDGFTLLPVAA